MPELQIQPFSEDHIDAATSLLEERHAHHRAVEPGLPANADYRAEIEALWKAKERSGAVAIRDGDLVGYLLGVHREDETWASNIWVEHAGHAVREPELVPDLYGAAAEEWVARGRNAHYVLVPATDRELVDAWFRLSFGAQHAAAIQETPEPTADSPGGVVVRRAEREDIEAATALDLELARHQARSPVFSQIAPSAITDEDREEVLTDIDDPEVGLFLAEIDGKAVGELLMVPVERSSMHVGLARPERAAFLAYAATVPEARGSGAGLGPDERRPRLGPRAGLSGDRGRLARDEPARVALLAGTRVPADLPQALPLDPVTRLPLAYGSRLALVDADDDAVVLAPPPPVEPIVDIAAAVRDALRFPLEGQPLEALVPRGARATIVVEPPSLPIPGSLGDPRRAAIAATMAELDRAGATFDRQTLLVAGGLGRRAGHRELELLVPPEFARRFHGRVEVHDAEREDLVEIPDVDRPVRGPPGARRRRHRRSGHRGRDGAPRRSGCALAAADGQALRSANAYSLLETSGSSGWRLALGLERALARRVALLGVSLTLNTPALGGVLHGYPHDREAVRRIANFPLGGLFGLLPGPVRRGVLRHLPSELSASAVFAGPPSVAHAEALLRGVDSKATRLEERLDVICIGVPHTTAMLPREAPNPMSAAYLGLGLALRLWRDEFPVNEGGTAILLSRFTKRFPHPTQQPYRALFQAARSSGARDPEELAEAEQLAGSDDRAIESYRGGRSCHPLLPFAEWSACQPAIERLGAVLIAGCRDSSAARQLGFVPAHGIGPALEMAHGRAAGPPRIGYLLSPPYFPLRVGEG